MFVCSIRSISYKTLEGPQLDLGPVEAVEGAKTCQKWQCWKNYGLLKRSKVASKSWVTIKTRHSLDAHDVDASSECLVRSVGANFGATFDRFDKVF